MSDKENILSIDFDDDDKDYLAFSELIENDTKRKKKKMAREIESMGETLVTQIEEKKLKDELKKESLIRHILKRDKSYSREELEEYDYESIRDIYYETKEKNQPFFKKLFRFLFNL